MLHKIIKKAGPDLHIFLNSVVLLFAVVMVTMVGYVVWKHLLLKSSVYMFVNQAEIATKQRYVGASGVEDAQMLATTIGTVPSTKPLYLQKDELQKYVSALSKQTGRDIVVEDKSQIILADAIPSNVGKYYTYGSGLDLETIHDGKARRFTEISTDYPHGIDEIVVPLKDATGTTLGAVVMSTSSVFAN